MALCVYRVASLFMAADPELPHSRAYLLSAGEWVTSFATSSAVTGVLKGVEVSAEEADRLRLPDFPLDAAQK